MVRKGLQFSGMHEMDPGRVPSMGLVTLGLLLVLTFMTGPLFTTETSADVGKAPDFELRDTDGDTWTLRQFEGKKVVLLDLMAINCSSCKIVESHLRRLYPDYRDHVFVLSIDVWSNVETEGELRRHKAESGIPWSMAMDTDDILTKYNAYEIAKVVIIDMDGFAVFENTGVTSEGQMRDKLDMALKGEGTPIEINPVSLWILAVFAGVTSFFSPCSFPMLPGYMSSYFSKHLGSKETRVRPVKAIASGSATAAGIITVYVTLGGVILLLGGIIVPYIGSLQFIIGIILVVLGALMLSNIQYEPVIAPFRRFVDLLRRKMHALGQRHGKVGTGRTTGTGKAVGFYPGLFVYGMGYGGCASVCTLPIFLGVILSGIASGSLWTGMLLLLVYTLVAGGLMIVITLALSLLGAVTVQRLARYTGHIKKVGAVILLTAGIYLMVFWLVAYGFLELPF